MKTRDTPNTVDIFGIAYAATDYSEASGLILQQALKRASFSVFALPVHGVVERRNDKGFAIAVDAADMVVPDGQPIRWLMNWWHHTRLQDRVYGPELLRSVLARDRIETLRVYVYGGRTDLVQKRFIDYIEGHFPNVLVCGAYREEHPETQTLMAADVERCAPHLVVVGIGCPKQEKWIARNQAEINAAMMGVGAAFGFFSGDQPVAPKWMQERGLEWLYRLVKEPRRLWRRYFYTNSVFVLMVLGEVCRRLMARLRGI